MTFAVPLTASLLFLISAPSIIRRVQTSRRQDTLRISGFALILFSLNSMAVATIAFGCGALVGFLIG